MNKRRESIDIQLGDTVRSLRIQKKLKIKDIAESTGLSSSLISQVERAIIAPSIETLKKIAASLEVPLSYFFVDAADEGNFAVSSAPTQVTRKVSPVVHPHERKLLSPGKGTTFYLLNPDLSGPIEFIFNVYEPGSNTGRNQYSHPGFECGLILSGELLITIEDETYLLKEGDSITFDSNRPHSKSNISDKPCTCVWANNPPWF